MMKMVAHSIKQQVTFKSWSHHSLPEELESEVWDLIIKIILIDFPLKTVEFSQFILVIFFLSI